MTTATRSVAVVATRLPNIDRRALSQAWFSALHIATPGSGALHPVAHATQLASNAPRSTKSERKPIDATRAKPVQPAHAHATRPPGGVVTAERRGPVGDLARRIERAIVRHGPIRAHQSASIAIDTGNGRIAILVRNDGSTTRIVALCAPHLRERVDRALAHARFALAASGTRLETAS